ncbi:hypothetical protein [Neisseria sp.]|uniref:hypothetical protein n=1 Tax=Neisseria sp. TaxID=192066 RepID=UPI002896EA67|nr:hypothetical protein [Neisseria sp.]
MNVFSKFKYKDTVYDLTHLKPLTCEYIQSPNEKGQSEKRYRCIIEFSTHCFTKGPNTRKNETLADFDPALHYITEKETRIFCFDRYYVSHQLPEILREIDKRHCFFTSADDKFLTVSLIGKDGKEIDYEIYFSLRRAKEKKYDVHIFINSAYIRDKNYGGVQPSRKKVSLFVLLHNTLMNKKIKRPK